MRLHDRTVIERLPGSTQSRTTQFHEWVCPECDYFEETEELAEAD